MICRPSPFEVSHLWLVALVALVVLVALVALWRSQVAALVLLVLGSQ